MSTRFCAVCDPYEYKENSKPDNVNGRVFKYFLIVIIFSVFINSPRFLETRIVTESFKTNNSGSVEVIFHTTYDVTNLRRNPDYIR